MPAPPDALELARELDRLRTAGRENRAFIRATRRELRKPLNALAGILRDLSAQTADRETGHTIRTALNWIISLGRLTNDLLELAVLQADDAEVGAVEFDLRDAVEEVSSSTRAEGAQVAAIRVEVRPEVPSMLLGHPNRLRQILVAGAQHIFATRQAAALELDLERLAETQTHVELLFALRNPAPADLPLGADELESAAQNDFGLLVAQRLARGLGGTLELLDGGDTLELRIRMKKFNAPEDLLDAPMSWPEAEAGVAPPALAPAAAPAPVPAAATPAAPEPGADPAVELPEITLTGTRVLLAGSSGPSNVALQIELRALGCESASAGTVGDACDLLLDSSRRLRPFHICIADFSGSDVEAEHLIVRVRAEEELRHLQMMLLVEVGSSGDAEWAEHLGYAAYLTKPVQRDELGAVFKELLQRSVAADSETARLVTRHSMRETRRRRLNCLVVDDDRVNLLVLKTVIERLGHAVDMASCGTEALEKAMQQRYDLILSDVRMPDIDGDEVATRLLAAQSARGERPTPIFAMSANSLPGDSQRCRAAGMRNYFHKPVTLPLLAQLLRYALEDGAEPAAAETGSPTDAQAAVGAATHATDGAAANPVPEQDAQDMDRSARFGEVTPIDLDHLEMASVGVPELRREMLKTFQLEMAAGIERLGDFIDDGNHGGAAVLASALNSTCASIGAMECARHLGEIERRASAGDLRPLGTLYAESLAEWDRVKAFAATLLDEQAAPGS